MARTFLFCPHVGIGVAIKMSIAVNNDKILINLEKNMEQLTMREQ